MNATKHGGFATQALNEQDRERTEHIEQTLGDPRLQRQMAAATIRRAERLVEWEAGHDPSPLTGPALLAASRVFANLPTEATAEEHRCLDDDAIRRQVDALLADPEFFLKRLDPKVADKVRQVLREATKPNGA